MTGTADPGSFRDPAGFVFRRAGTLYRQVNQSYASTFEQLEKAGFLRALQDDGLLIAHDRLGAEAASTPDAFAVLQPDLIPFVSYPYEWCFGQLKDAAILTLELQRRALDAGFILRDGSAYNVQFRGGRAVKSAKDGAALDGFRAHQFHLIRSEAERKLSPETRARRDALEFSISKLRETKRALPEEVYYETLEALLLELARLYESDK